MYDGSDIVIPFRHRSNSERSVSVGARRLSARITRPIFELILFKRKTPFILTLVAFNKKRHQAGGH